MGYGNKNPRSEHDAPEQPKIPTDDPTDEALKLDYEQTIGFIKTLIETRYKLIALVPTLTAAGVALLTRPSSQTVNIDQIAFLGVGILGFFVTFGILLNELRNSAIHDAAVGRARNLETALGFEDGGLFNNRPAVPKSFAGLHVWTDRAIALVYGSALGGWIFVILNSLLGILSTYVVLSSMTISIVSLLVAAIVTVLIIWESLRYGTYGADSEEAYYSRKDS